MKYGLVPTYEIKLLKKGYDLIIGIDEAGRGPWAGPLSVAGFIFSHESKLIKGIQDSKKLTKKQRQFAFEIIEKQSLNNKLVYFHSFTPSKKIDGSGLGNVLDLSIQNIMEKVHKTFSGQRIKFLIDGYFKRKFDGDFELIKKGDSKFYSIAAASVIAKYKRDLLMMDYAKKFPEYGFDKHVGYGTKFHRIQLQKYGPCPIHRKSFAPIKNLFNGC